MDTCEFPGLEKLRGVYSTVLTVMSRRKSPPPTGCGFNCIYLPLNLIKFSEVFVPLRPAVLIPIWFWVWV